MKGTMVLFIAVIVGLLAAVLAKSHLEDTVDREIKDWIPQDVCVAAMDLLPGHTISQDDITVIQVPKHLAMKGYVLGDAKDTLNDLQVRVEITKGKMIDRYYLGRVEVNKSGGPSDVDVNEPDYRLIPIKVNESTGIAGYLKKNDHVDVLHTNKNKTTQMMLQNVLVRYVGRSGTGANRRSTYSSITVQLKPRQAMALTNAMETGTIMLIKRGAGDYTNIKIPNPINPTDDYPKELGKK
jgi:pilus assembly protein CpaB